jgi:hypothetical protein
MYHNNDSGIMVEYITGTLNSWKFGCYTEAEDSGLQGPETPVCDLVSTEDVGWTPQTLALSWAGDFCL